MNKKYKFDFHDTIAIEDGHMLYRIIALVDIGDTVKAGDKGGYIESGKNLSQLGDCWVGDNAQVYGNACVSGYAQVYGNAKVYGNSNIYGSAQVYGNAKVFDDALIYGNAGVSGNARICDDANVYRNEDYFCVQSFGSMGRSTTLFRTKEGWLIDCGCFKGTVEQFRKAIVKNHGDSFIAQEYLMIADLAELRIKRCCQIRAEFPGID